MLDEAPRLSNSKWTAPLWLLHRRRRSLSYDLSNLRLSVAQRNECMIIRDPVDACGANLAIIAAVVAFPIYAESVASLQSQVINLLVGLNNAQMLGAVSDCDYPSNDLEWSTKAVIQTQCTTTCTCCTGLLLFPPVCEEDYWHNTSGGGWICETIVFR